MLLSPTSATLRRPATGTTGSDGRPAAPSYTDTTITVSAQPASGQTRQMLDEGNRRRQPIEVETYSELRMVDQHAGTSGDLLVIGGVTYELFSVEDCPALGGIPRHWYAVALRRQEIRP